MFKNVLKKVVTVVTICVVVSSGMYIPQNKAKAADEMQHDNGAENVVDTSDWQKSIVVDFGVTSDLDAEGNPIPGICEDGQIQLKQVLGETRTAVPVEGRGNWLYENTTIQDIYGTTATVKQKMGFDKVVPAGITEAGGNYFKDWVFSPDGEEYSFSVDLPVGQYYVAVYTGNKVAKFDNTTCVRFNDESFMMGETEVPVVYEQTSAGGGQFYGETKKELVYVVDVKDNGQGYGTLKATFFDNTDCEASHNLTVGDVYHVPAEGEEAKAHGVKSLDLYEGTEAEISREAISEKIITARLNGFEIVPVEEPAHALETRTFERTVEAGYTGSLYEAEPDVVITDRSYYVSSDPSILSVNKYTGEINALKAGIATVYEYNAYLDAVSEVEVLVLVERILDKISLSLDMNGEAYPNKTTLTATFNKEAEDIVEWNVSDEGVVALSEPVFTSEEGCKKSTVELKALNIGNIKVSATIKIGEKTIIANCNVKVGKVEKSATPTPVPDSDNNTVMTEQTDNGYIHTGYVPDKKHVCIYKVKVDGKKTTSLKVKKSIKFNVKAFGTKVKKVKCVVKSGKKLVTVKATKKSVRIKAKKRGKVKLVIKVTTTNNRVMTYKRTIKIK